MTGAARWRAAELAFWLVPVAAYFLFPGYLVLGSQVLIAGLFALSLDLVLGYAGIVSLGHAAFFGVGAYAAGLLSARLGWGEPLTGLAVAALAAAALGFAASFLVVRGRDLTRLMVTLGIGLLVYELANRAAFLTGGVDGLAGVTTWKLLGWRAFDLEGRTAYLYSLAVLFAAFVLARRVVASPFGLSLRGIREGRARMPAIGAPVRARLVAAYTLGAAVAGVAGGLLAQTTQFVGLDTLAFHRSAEVLIILVLGGTGRLYGGLVGAAVFLVAQDWLAGIDPVYWRAVDRAAAHADRALRPRRHPGGGRGAGPPILADARLVTPALRTEGLTRTFGAFVANADIALSFPPGARWALIGPNGAGKTTLVNLLTGALAPTRGEVFLDGERVTRLGQHERVRRGLARTFQVNTLFAGLTVLDSVTLAACERTGAAWHALRPVARQDAEIDEARSLLARLGLARDAGTLTGHLPYGKQRLVEIALALATRPRVLLLDEPAAGVPADQAAEVFAVLDALPADVAIVLIEHDMDLVFRFAERIAVLVAGRVLMEGPPEDVARDERVREVYLGEARHG